MKDSPLGAARACIRTTRLWRARVVLSSRALQNDVRPRSTLSRPPPHTMSPRRETATYWARRLLSIPQPDETSTDRVSRGESIATSVTANPYVEQDPTVKEYLRDLWPSKAAADHYLRSLLPCIDWLPRYNRIWLVGDLVAGITVGAVVVPQGMAVSAAVLLESPDFLTGPSVRQISQLGTRVRVVQLLCRCPALFRFCDVERVRSFSAARPHSASLIPTCAVSRLAPSLS